MSFRHLMICLLLVGLSLSSRSRLAADELPVWTSIGPDGGNVQALAVSPALPNLVLAGTGQGYGIFKSANRGNSWAASTDDAGRNVLDLAITANGKAFYAATNRGLLKSAASGVRWRALDPSPDVYTLVAAHPRKPAVVFAVRGGVLLRSTNGGVTREPVDGPEEVARIAFALVGQRTVVYAGAGNGLWRSTDDGRTWTDVSPSFASPPRVAAVAVDPRNPRILYIGLQQGRRALFKSQDGGATWRLSQRGLPAAGGNVPVVSELAVDRSNSSIVHAVAGGALFRSINGGRDWSRPVPELPGGSVNTLEAAPYGVLAGTPAGVLLSTDRGITWRLRITGLAATSIDGMAIDHQEPARLYATDLPWGTFATSTGGRPWVRLGNLPGQPAVSAMLAVDPVDPDVAYNGSGNRFFKSTDGGQSWIRLATFNSCVALLRIVIDPRVPDHLFASAGLEPPCLDPFICTFLHSLDGGETWGCLMGDPADRRSFLGVDPLTSAIYAETSLGLERSTDDGETWTSVGGFPPGISGFAGFTISPLVEGTLWAVQGRLVLRSRDGGGTWEAFSTGLPSGEAVVALAPDPADPATLYAASRHSGILKSIDSGETWNQAGLWPAGAVFKGNLLVDPGEPAVLYAGTDGLGVLRLDQSGI